MSLFVSHGGATALSHVPSRPVQSSISRWTWDSFCVIEGVYHSHKKNVSSCEAPLPIGPADHHIEAFFRTRATPWKSDDRHGRLSARLLPWCLFLSESSERRRKSLLEVSISDTCSLSGYSDRYLWTMQSAQVWMRRIYDWIWIWLLESTNSYSHEQAK
jgi:hypothetical protein